MQCYHHEPARDALLKKCCATVTAASLLEENVSSDVFFKTRFGWVLLGIGGIVVCCGQLRKYVAFIENLRKRCLERMCTLFAIWRLPARLLKDGIVD